MQCPSADRGSMELDRLKAALATARVGPSLTIEHADIMYGEQLGSGGFSVVYKGSWLGTLVAIKTWFDGNATAEQRCNIRQEVMTLAGLHHPHIVTFCGSCSNASNTVMVTELLPFSLHDVLYSMPNVTLQMSNCVKIAIDICRAFRYLHTRTPQIIHRDLKPSNVLLDRAWKVKICDFGLASCGKSSAGTPHYMAPELLRNETYTDKVDVYAFGILLGELLSRKPPFAGLDPARVVDLVLAGQRPDLSACVPAPLADIVRDCWHADAQKRPCFKQLQDTLAGLEMA